MSNFIQLFATKDKPLLLFLDDLQWADIPSLRLIESMANDVNKKHIMIIGAYRDNELGQDHPLKAVLKGLKGRNNVSQLLLGPLNEEDINGIITSSLHCQPEDTASLSGLCMSKTGGNPFSIVQFLYSLNDEGVLWFDRDKKSWIWDEERIQSRNVMDNVVDLVIKKIERLPAETAEVLKMAACINNTFDVKTLAIVAGKPQDTIEKALKRAIKEEMVIITEGQYKFLHNRIQQAAYLLLEENVKSQTHYKIGKRLINCLPEQEIEDKLLEIADHLNQGTVWAIENKEENLLIDINLRAGKKSKASSDYERALEYLSNAVAMLGEDCWENNYEQTLELYIEAAEVAYVCTRFDLMKRLTNETLKNGKNDLDKAMAYKIMIEAYSVENDLDKALDIARDMLKLFGVRLPRKPMIFNVIYAYVKTRLALWRKPVDNLLDLEPMSDKRYITALKIMNSASIASYSSSYYTTVLIVFNALLISLKYGNTDESIIAYSGYGHILDALIGKVEEGYKFGLLSLELQKKLDVKRLESKTTMMFNMMIRHGKEPLRDTLLDFPESYQKGFASGDLISAGYSIVQYIAYSYFSGIELAKIQEEAHKHSGALLKTKHKTSIYLCRAYLQAISNLMGESEDECRLIGKYYNEDEMLGKLKSINDRTNVFNVYFNRMILNYLFGNYKRAEEDIYKLEEYVDGVAGTYCTTLMVFYKALILAANFSNLRGLGKVRVLMTINKCIDKMRKLAEYAPENNLNKLYLMEAERERIKGNYLMAGQYYDNSILLAYKNKFLQEEALANELAAKFYMSAGSEKAARKYLEDAYECYKKWGAVSKVSQLINEYPGILQEYSIKKDSSSIKANQKEFNMENADSLDLLAIIRSSQAISGEIVLEDLLKTLMKIILEDAGAQRAALIIRSKGRLIIEAEGNAEENRIEVLRSAPVDEMCGIPIGLINYVERTGESIVLNYGENLELFIPDWTDKDDVPKSVICLPIIAKREMLGLLYLENRLIKGAFTANHLHVLQLLSSQIAISLEHAMLYRDMENIVKERTEELNKSNLELMTINKELEAANQAKDQFMANMSHEIRTPLSGIMGMASMLLKSGLGEKENEYASMIHSSAESLLEIINDILDFSKIEAKKLELEEKPFSLKQLLREIRNSFDYSARSKGIQLDCTVERNMPEYFKGDSLRVRQIITNILGNAIKFTYKGKVELSALLEGYDKNNAIVKIIVSDTGIGIPEDKLQIIFESFTQADSSVARSFGGTGLGLAITKRLVEMMNGIIKVESKVGVGSVFTCIIPFQLPNEEDDAWKETAAASSRSDIGGHKFIGLKIAVAEDNEVNQKYIKALLEYLGCEALLTQNGEELLEVLEKENFDAILMDKNMPDMDGIETSRIIRERERLTGRHIPIIALTASAIKGDKEKLLAAGMDYYLAKPLTEKELVGVLMEIAAGKTLHTASGKQEKADAGPQEISETGTLINNAVFLEEAALFGHGLIKDIVKDFLESYEEKIRSINESLEKSDFKTVEHQIHKMAGTISTFHADVPFKAAKKLEQDAHEMNLAECKRDMEQLSEILQRLRAELEQIIKSL